MNTDNLAFVVFFVLLIAIIAVAIRGNLFHDAGDMAKAVQIGKHNIDYQFFPDRSKPLILATKELGLRQFYPDFFKKFTRDDWQEFWDIIYGVHPLIEFENEKLAAADRNYFVGEIQVVLADRYPDGFAHFDAEAWKTFWKQIQDINPGVPPNLLGGDFKQKEREDQRLERKIRRDTARVQETIEDVGAIDAIKEK